MAKRYLTIEEAAAKLGMSKDELNRLRERGEIRGFADRGTFKFKEDDVEELARRRQPSSDPDVPMIDGDDDASVFDDEPSSRDSALDGAPTFIRQLAGGEAKAPESDDAAGSIFDDFGKGGTSDSDVRLVMDDRLEAGHDSGSDVMLQFAESDSDVRLFADDDSKTKRKMADSDSDVRLAVDAPAAPAATGKSRKPVLSDSDSDVRLDGASDLNLATPDSDSDVQLAPSPEDSAPLLPKPDSDSDVILVGQEPDSDSDVHLATDDDKLPVAPQSDSDVQLIGADSDSDVRLLDDAVIAGPKSKLKKDSDSDVAVLPDSDVTLDGSSGDSRPGKPKASVLLDDSDVALDHGSGISLGSDSVINLVAPQSGVALDRVADSGLSLEKMGDAPDSGLSLFDEEEDGGITLASDSGIALSAEDDSGISLFGEEEDDGGITLDETGADSGIALKDDDGDLQLTETLPTMKMPKGKPTANAEDSMGDTMLEVPSVDTSDEVEAESDFEIGAADGGSQGDTSVLLFDDEDGADDGAVMVKDEEQPEEEAFEFTEEEEEEPDVIAGDEAFEEDAEFEPEEQMATVAKATGPIEYPWGAGVVSMLAVSSIVMLLCGMASIDLVRSMWGWDGYSPANGWLIETLGGLFK